MGDAEPTAAVKEQRRSARSTRQLVDCRALTDRPGEDARKAAFQYLDATFDSVATAASRWGVDRQLVRYHVNKLMSAGVPLLERKSAAPESSDAGAEEGNRDQYTTWCKAWQYAAEQHRMMSALGPRVRGVTSVMTINEARTHLVLMQSGCVCKTLAFPLVIPI